MNHQTILQDLKQISRQAGAEILKFYNQEFSEEDKDNKFPVTKADLASNDVILQGLQKYKDQGLGILSEETKEDRSYLECKNIFIVDPLDGTKDFIHKTGDFSVMIAYLEGKELKIGVVYKPATDIMYWAIKGEGAFKEEKGEVKQIHVSDESDLSQMKLLVSRFHVRDEELKLKEKLGLLDFEQMGSVAKMCLVGDGSAHLYVSTATTTGEWDSAAPTIIAQEAGAKVTSMSGGELEFQKTEPLNTDGFVATNNKKHQEILGAIKKVLSE